MKFQIIDQIIRILAAFSTGIIGAIAMVFWLLGAFYPKPTIETLKYDVALFTIQKMGYSIRIEPVEEADDNVYWIANKGKIVISAFSPLSLLALVLIFEQYASDWNKIETGNIYNKTLSNLSLLYCA